MDIKLGKKIKNLASLKDRFKKSSKNDVKPSSKSEPSSPSRPTKRSLEAKESNKNDDKVSISKESRKKEESGSVDASDGLLDGIKDWFFGRDDTRRAEEHDKDATVAVFDGFSGADGKGESTHGEQVEGIIQANNGLNDEDVQRYQINGGGPSISDFKDRVADNDEDALKDLVEGRFTGLMDNTTGALEEILDDKDSKIRTINQSQSQAEGRVTNEIWKEAKKDSEFRENLAENLGFDADVSDKDLAQGLVDGVGDVVGDSDKIRDSKKRYQEVSKKAADAGITHVVTSGNLGTFAKELENLGVETDSRFYDSNLKNSNKIVVAASDHTTKSKLPTSAGFNSPNANADIAAPGVDIDLVTQDGEKERNSGTSFAAPMVAGTVAKITAENPDLTPREIRRLLQDTSLQTKENYRDFGAGDLDEEAALAAAA